MSNDATHIRSLATILICLTPRFASADSLEKKAPEHGPGTNRDHECLVCHAGIGEEDSPKLDMDAYNASVHAKEGCVGCHEEVANVVIKHEEKDADLPPVRCGSCHHEIEDQYTASIHAKKPEDPKREATCAKCHGMHDILPVKSLSARVNPVRQPETCSECHGKREVAGHSMEIPAAAKAKLATATPEEIDEMMKKHELVSAACSDCHSSHSMLPRKDVGSELYPSNVVSTCAPCHDKEAKAYDVSAHGQIAKKPGFKWELDKFGNVASPSEMKVDPGEKPTEPPVCSSCHVIHGSDHERKAATPTSEQFRLEIIRECGNCHRRLMETYVESYHGKATVLGNATVAKCSDCHTAHENLPASDPKSTVSKERMVETCRKCHEKAPENYMGFWAHADPHDRDRYPALYWIFIFMSTLLIGVFSFFGLHTLLWGIREVIDAVKSPTPKHAHAGPKVSRFTPGERLTHFFVVISFLGLAATGAPLKFAQTEWAKYVFDLIGGVKAAGTLHRIFAVITFGYFFGHLVMLAVRFARFAKEGTLIKKLIGPDSLVPAPRDVFDVFNHMKYFVGLGPKPTWDRWTYWEKFDYWAVFWGVAIIGSSGLIMWFPTTFTLVLPGWAINIAAFVHSDEALLAIGFIFGVHFFNSHLRRTKFPMDPVIFTGSLPEEEFKAERGREWERMVKEGRTESRRAGPTGEVFLKIAYVFGISAWLFGLILLALIIHGFFFA